MNKDNDDARLTKDALFNGALTLWQPKTGFRVNLDTVLLAAAADRGAGTTLELGAGAGGVSLALAQHCPKMQITAAELNPLMAALLERNVADNNLLGQVTPVRADALADQPAWAGRFDQAVLNPPYHDAASTLAQDARTSMAKATTGLTPWIKAAAAALKRKGRITMISRGDRIDQIITALAPDFGEVTIRPIFARPVDQCVIHTPREPLTQSLTQPSADAASDQPAAAKRVLISARKGMRGGAAILPPLVIYAEATGNALTPEMAAIDAGAAQIPMASPHYHSSTRRSSPPTPPEERFLKDPS